MAPRAFLGSLLPLAAAAHNDGTFSRRLTFNLTKEPIYGNCDHLSSRTDSCVPFAGFHCSDRLSDGPDDADIEMAIGGLPNSTAVEPVHLQFWSARGSPTKYDPFVSLANCSIYNDLSDGYPRYDASDFNGGNVLVSETGQATIRVRAPAMYVLAKFFEHIEDSWAIDFPHIHLRLCHGDLVHPPLHHIFIGWSEYWLEGTDWPRVDLLWAGRYGNSSASMPVDPSAPEPISIVPGPAQTTQTMTTSTKTFSTATTTEGPPQVSILDPAHKVVLINAAKGALDLEALEFSPVYQCLLKGGFFDHFASDCSTHCPAKSDLEHGQCVQPQTDDEVAWLAVTWKLEINCGEPCWHDKKLVSLHNVRLSVADLLDIPFQEVEVEMGFPQSGYLTGAAAKTAYLTVGVTSNRLVPVAGANLLEQFARSQSFISQLLGLDVLSVTVSTRPEGNLLEELLKMDADNDPYEPAYTALETSPLDVPDSATAIIGIAVGVVVVILSVIVGTLVWRLRRAQQARKARANAQEEPDPEEPNAVAAPEEPAGEAKLAVAAPEEPAGEAKLDPEL